MKFLLVAALSVLALANAQTTVNVPLSLVGNADGSATIKIGSGAAVTIPAGTVTAAKGVVGLINSVVSGISATTNINGNLGVTVDPSTGAITATFNGQTLALPKGTIQTVAGLMKKIQKAVRAAFPKPTGRRSRKHSNEKRH